MKTNLLRYTSIALLLFLIACSTKKNSFLSRNSHALSSKYNILYNGGLALDKGVIDLKSQYKDNFWEVLPIERMQISVENSLPGQSNRNPNFERAETKSAKAIQKHSMNIAGSEKNPQMDEAHLMLGKSRYYDQRFIPALEAFNYILYKYPNSDKIYEAKIWREKTNIRLDNDALAVTNLNKLLKEIKFKDQIFADANASLAQAFLNLEEKDSAVAKLKLAKEFTRENEEKARYDFILGQLYEELGHKDSAYASYQNVIDMKRKAARQYVIQAHARQAAQFDYKSGDTTAFVKKFNDLLEDRENRPYLDVLNHQMALFYDKNKKFDDAKKYYNRSLKLKSQDQYLTASNYRNLADIYFNDARYVSAGKYFDSTLVQLNPRTREYRTIKKKRENLVDVIKYEAIATKNDSIINVFRMSPEARISYYEAYIAKLKKDDEKARILLEKQQQAGDNGNSGTALADAGKSDGSVQKMKSDLDQAAANPAKKSLMPAAQNASQPPSTSYTASSGGNNNFYFYNPTSVAFGKNEFRKVWGDRRLKDNWRLSSNKSGANKSDDDEDAIGSDNADSDVAKVDKPDERYTTDYYIKQIPTAQVAIDSMAKERNFAYYQLGVIYKEKFKEYKRAADKLEKLLENNPEERLVLPSMYNLYKLYEILDKDKAAAMKERIIKQYPDSRYAQILGNPNPDVALNDTPEAAYNKLYKIYESGDYKRVLTSLELAIDQYTGEEVVPKFELLKANTVGKLKGLEEYKKALNFVALTYPNSEEGKSAELLLDREVPIMEGLKFNTVEPLSWKVVYRAGNPDDKKTKALTDKINKFIKDRSISKMSVSNDIYTMDKNFVVIHGMKTQEYAAGIASILKEVKEYKVPDQAYIISSDNYKIVQIKKNFEEFLKVGSQPIVPQAAPVVAPKPVETQMPVNPKLPQPKVSPAKQDVQTPQNLNNSINAQDNFSDPEQNLPQRTRSAIAPPGGNEPEVKKGK